MSENVRKVAVNGSGGAFTSIVAQSACRKVEIMEVEGAAGTTGLDYQVPDDNFGATYSIGFDKQPLMLPWDEPAFQSGRGRLLGGPAQTDPAGRTIAARTLCKLRSQAAGGTTVMVIEHS